MRSLASKFKRSEESAQSHQLFQGLKKVIKAMTKDQDIPKTCLNLDIARLNYQMI